MSDARHVPPPRTSEGVPRMGARGQRGAITVLGVFTLLLALMLTGLTLETARLWLTKRELQSTADMAAMAAARHTGCGSTRASALQAAQSVVVANGLTSGYTLDMRRGIHGRDAISRVNTFQVNESESSNAAQVTLTRTVEPSLLASGLLSSNSTVMKVTATAKGGPPQAAYSIASFASITQRQADFTTALFRALIGNSSLNLGISALTDLAGTSINLLALQAAAGAATIEELLDRQVPISELFRWLATASPSAAAATQLNQLGSISVNSGLKVRLRDVLNIQIPASAASATVGINVLDLIQTSLLVGKGPGTINLGLNIAGVGNISLNLLNPPRIAVGPAGKSLAGAWCTEAKSAQFSLKVGLNLNLIVAALDMALYVDTLQTAGRLSTLAIAPGNTTGNFSIASDVIVLRLNDAKTTDGSKRATVSVLGIPVVGIDLKLPLLSASNASAPFTIQSTAQLPQAVATRGVGSGTLGGLLGDGTTIKFVVLGILPFDLSWLQGVIMAPLKLIADLVVEPLLQIFGFDIGLVRVRLIDVESAKPLLII